MSDELCFGWPMPSEKNWGEHYPAVSSFWPLEIKSCYLLRHKFCALLAKLSLRKVRNRETLLGLWNDNKLEPIWLQTINAETYRATFCDYPADDVESVVVALHDIVRAARAPQLAQYPTLNRWKWRAYCVTCTELAEKNKLRCPRCAKARTDKGGEIDDICEEIRRTMRCTNRHQMLAREADIRWVASTIWRRNNVETAIKKMKREQREALAHHAKLPEDTQEKAWEQKIGAVPRHVLLANRLEMLIEFSAVFYK